MKPSRPVAEPSPQIPAAWLRPKVITFLVVLLVTYWVSAHWSDIKAGARDGWADYSAR